MSEPNTPADGPATSGPTLQSEAQRLATAARGRAAEAAEELKVASNQVVDQVRELIEDANVKRVTIKKGEKTLLEIPLTVGVGAGAAALLMNPVLSAVGALAALVSDITLVVERDAEAAVKAEARAEAADHPAVENVNDPEPSAEADKTVGK